MNIRFSHSVFVMAGLVWGGLTLAPQESVAQKTAARRIEFSEPLRPSPSTNVQDIRADRSGLSELEERLSKTFDFFDVHNSLNGAPAPKVHPVRIITKDSKSSGILGEDSGWTGSPDNTDILSKIRDNGDAKGPSEKAGPAFRDLTGDDWLVKQDMQETFWNLPATPVGETPTFSQPVERSRRSGSRSSHSKQASTSAKPNVASAFAKAASKTTSGQPREFALSGQDTQFEMDPLVGRRATAAARRRSTFRELLGMPALAATAASARGVASQDQRNNSQGQQSDITGWSLNTPESSMDLSGRSRGRHSLNPVLPSDASYLMPGLPGLPQASTHQNQNEPQQTSRPNHFQDRLLSSPFSEPLKRGF